MLTLRGIDVVEGNVSLSDRLTLHSHTRSLGQSEDLDVKYSLHVWHPIHWLCGTTSC